MTGASLTRWADWPYRTGAAVHGALYRRGLVRRQHLGGHTVSVGAVHFGGAGKTPLVRALAGEGDAVLIRGYGGRTRSPRACAVLLGQGDEPGTPVWERELRRGQERRPAHEWSGELGDEAVLLAATLPGVPVGIGADRGRAAVAVAAGAEVRRWLLDDGFSHHRVARDADVVALPAVRGRDGVHIAPGPWREGRAALRRASVVVAVFDESEEFQDVDIDFLRKEMNFSGPLAVVGKCPGEVRRYPDGAVVAAGALRGVSAFAVCALGRPRSFQAQLMALGAVPAGFRWFRDHHRFRPAELRAAERLAAAAGAEVVLTSLKDAVRFPPAWRPAANWMVMDLALTWERGHAALLEVVRAP